MEVRTHNLASRKFVGTPVEIKPGYCKATLQTNWEMAVDHFGLIHGGFTFGLADFAAMIAVNEPNVVLVSSEAKFLKPVKVGDRLVAEAKVTSNEGRKYEVRTVVKRGKEVVFEGIMICYVPSRHVLEGRRCAG